MFSSWSRKKICISFDYHNDRNYRYMLSAWIANPNFPFDFEDLTPGEINTSSVDRVKARLNTQIRAANYTMVLIGAHANSVHPDSKLIGTRNWIWWEIEQSKLAGNRLIAIKLERSNVAPDPVLSAGASWAYDFTRDDVLKAIKAA